MRARLGSACHSHHPTRRDEADIARASSDSAMPTGDSSMQEKIPNAKSENAVRSQNFSLSFSLSAKAERKAETPPPRERPFQPLEAKAGAAFSLFVGRFSLSVAKASKHNGNEICDFHK